MINNDRCYLATKNETHLIEKQKIAAEFTALVYYLTHLQLA